MSLFRRMRAALYRWRLRRIDRRLDALQARRHGQPERVDVRQLSLEFDALAIDRAVTARRLARLSDASGAMHVPRRQQATAAAETAMVERYLQLDEELGAALARDGDDATLERLAQQRAAAQREIESGRAGRVP